MRTEHSYFYPGTHTLRNVPGILDPVRLREFEEQATLIRMSEMLIANPVPGGYDRQHLCDIHRRMLGDVYAWAGELRTPGAGLQKFGPSPASIRAGDYTAPDMYLYLYAVAGESMERLADTWFDRLPAPEPGMGPADVVEAIASPWGGINHAHQFREGNTRSQVVMFTYWVHAAGREIDHARFIHDPAFRAQFTAARYLFQGTSDPSLLRDTLSAVVS